jgi:hypothetical protein
MISFFLFNQQTYLFQQMLSCFARNNKTMSIQTEMMIVPKMCVGYTRDLKLRPFQIKAQVVSVSFNTSHRAVTYNTVYRRPFKIEVVKKVGQKIDKSFFLLITPRFSVFFARNN